MMWRQDVVGDVEHLLTPIRPDSDTGEWLRYELIYDQIQEARREDEEYLERGVWQQNLKKADWGLVRKLCTEALRKSSKDLQIAAWLAESWTVFDGLLGAIRGIVLIDELCDRYWDVVYPPIEDDFEYRTAPFVWMNDKLPQRLMYEPFGEPLMPGYPAYTFFDRENAIKLDALMRKDPYAFSDQEMSGKITLEKFQAALQNTPIEFFIRLQKNVVRLHKILAKLENSLDERCGKASPSFSKIKSMLAKFDLTLADIFKNRQSELPLDFDKNNDENEAIAAESAAENESWTNNGVHDTERLEADSASHEEKAVYLSEDPVQAAIPVARENAEAAKAILVAQSSGPAMSSRPTSETMTRAEAFELLEEVAKFLMKNEPHSPVPYLIRRAVSWGRMPLPQLLGEIVFDPNNKLAIFSLLGLEGDSHLSEE